MSSFGLVDEEQLVCSQNRDDRGLEIPGGPAGLGRGDRSLDQMPAAAVVDGPGWAGRRRVSRVDESVDHTVIMGPVVVSVPRDIP
jgi:hypothetical protein